MIALALDTATSSTVVGLRAGDGRVTHARDDVDPGERPRHTQRLLGIAAELLAAAGHGFGELELIVVGIGPGTFTGLRIGIAAARGLAHATGAPLVGLSTLRVLAAAAGPGPVLAMISAGRGEVFAAGYEDDVELLAPVAVAPTALAGLLGDRAWLAVGSGALRFRPQSLHLTIPPDDSPVHRVSAEAMLGLALGGAAVDARGAVTPLYLRLPDAELELRRTQPP